MANLIKLAVIGILIVVYLLRYFGLMSKPKPQPKVKKQAQPAPEKKLEKPSIQEEEKKSSKSFKELKAMASKKQKKAGSTDPTHPAFLQALKVKSAIKDFDVVSTHHWLFVIVAENDSAISAFAVRKQDDKPVVVKKTLNFQGALQICSCSIARPKTNTGNLINDTYKFVVAVATFDHCQTMFYQLNFENEELKFSPTPIKVTQNMHKLPVQKVRLSKQNPKFMVSCGAKSDVTVKLWNVASQDQEAINQIVTNQLVHREMTSSAETDLFAVATATSEIKVFKIGPPAKPIPGKEFVLEKALTLVTHKSDILTINMHGKLCASISRDNQLIIHKIDGEFPTGSVVFQMALNASTINDTTRVAVYHSDGFNHQTAYFALAYNSSHLEVYKLNLKDSKPAAVRVLGIEGDQVHNSQSVDFIEFVRVSQDVVLASGSGLDLKINLWNVGD